MYLVNDFNDNEPGSHIQIRTHTSKYSILIKLIWPNFSDILHKLLINQYDNIIHGKRKTIDLIISCPIA